MSKGKVIKSIYFYLVSFVALMMVVFSTANIINNILKTYVFTKADRYDFYPAYVPGCELERPMETKGPTSSLPSKEECEKQRKIQEENNTKSRSSQLQRDTVRDISMIVVGIPLFIWHWRIIRKKDENL